MLRELRGGAGRGLGAAAAFVQHGGVAALDDAVVLRVVLVRKHWQLHDTSRVSAKASYIDLAR